MKRYSLLFAVFLVISCGTNSRVNYKYMGSYSYMILNDSLHTYNSYLSPKSYGYVIGNLDFRCCGLKILDIEKLNQNDEYIITINHPIKNIFTDSKRIRGEGQSHLKKIPLEIELNKSVSSDSIYIYRLRPNDKYRLLLP